MDMKTTRPHMRRTNHTSMLESIIQGQEMLIEIKHSTLKAWTKHYVF